MQYCCEKAHPGWAPHLTPAEGTGRLQLPPEAALKEGASLEDLWRAYQATGTAFLDLQKMTAEPEAGLKDVGPCACLAGDLELLPWQFGSSSQA